MNPWMIRHKGKLVGKTDIGEVWILDYDLYLLNPIEQNDEIVDYTVNPLTIGNF
jgi:hypothetical protein